MHANRAIVVAAATCLIAGGSACRRGQTQKTPPAETQVSEPRQTSEQMTVTGCLKAGTATDTYVLTTAQTTGASETATYQLVGGDADTLKKQLGHRVQVSGTMSSEQDIASRSSAVENKAKGTSGTPVVETQTDVQIRRLHVDGLTPVAGQCKP